VITISRRGILELLAGASALTALQSEPTTLSESPQLLKHRHFANHRWLSYLHSMVI